uniref:Uncharacterized protein n=1 Tax=Arundo donax TaxID=35708 RepID=A0A0A9HTP1_ARUDO
MFQPRTSDAPHRIFAATVFSSSEPFAAILYNLSNSATLEAGVATRASFSGPESGAPCIKLNHGDSWGKVVSFEGPYDTT